MNGLEKKFNDLISRSKSLIPKKTKNGVQFGDLKIIQNHKQKTIYLYNQPLYQNIYLTQTALTLCHYIFFNEAIPKQMKLYTADQTYGHYLNECKIFSKSYDVKLKNRNIQDAEIAMARFTESNIKLKKQKKEIEKLIRNTLNKEQLDLLL